ncbi:MAG: lysylphosphatidylglycerol synthase transmembrane domain-containing protein [Solirubrobacterales bacterium]|nr:lysylphosphatidylglycerol synthase transmembrane domain-containing protein [Solirubrobacterales bacterium]
MADAHDQARGPFDDLDDDFPTRGDGSFKFRLTRKTLIGAIIFVACAIAFLYVVLPKIGGLNETWRRLDEGDGSWFAVAGLLEVGSYLGYIVALKVVIPSHKSRFTWSTAYLITMAGVAATRLFATAGVGGMALSFWGIRRTGLPRRQVAVNLTAFMVCLYSVFMVSALVGGIGLAAGVFNGPSPIGMTVVPAVLAGSVIAVFLLFALVPGDSERRLRAWSHGRGEVATVAGKLAAAPAAVAAGTRVALRLLKERHPGMLGAVAWWYFDIAVLWACLRAFGSEPAVVTIVMAYLVGQLGNLLPLPGGIGGVEGAMVGALAAFGIDAGLALVAVLSYRAFSFWLPTIPGAIAFVQLRQRATKWAEEDAGEPTPPGAPAKLAQ